jgi:D-alanyl-D-alanine carboxypeptidase
MRLRVILLTIFLGVIVWGAAFFVFLKELNREQTSQFQVNNTANHSAQAFLLPLAETNYLPARDFNVPEPVLSAKAAVLFDVQSGRFLFSKNPNQRLPIASITKLMSAVVILENLDLNEVFTVSPENINVDGKGADFYRNEQLRGIDLFKIMLIKSSNDAALAFATAARKKGIDFVAKMNEKAQTIGMFNTKFADPAGLDDWGGFSTASDLVKLMSCAGEHDLISRVLKTKSATVTSAAGGTIHHLTNTNRLLGQVPEVIMGKTGYTDGALGAIALETKIDQGQNVLISVILGSNDRFGEAAKLIQWGKEAYRWQ